MESLPILAVEEILQWLSGPDLLSASLVSLGWRHVCDNNKIWKKECYKQCNSHIVEYVNSVPSVVEPTFKEPKTNNSRLQPLCYWRIVYMKLQHIKHNWCLANHKVYNVTELAYNLYDLAIDQNMLIANVNDNMCEVWNICGGPRKQQTIHCALKNTRCKCLIHLSGEKLVVVQDTLLQVYCRVKKMFNLKFRRLFNQNEGDSQNIPGSLNIDDWYNEHVKLRPTHIQAVNTGNYFIGLAENGTFSSATFHIWDTVSGRKIKDQSIKELCQNNDAVFNITFCVSKTNIRRILVCIQHLRHTGDTYYSVIYDYDIALLSFRKLIVLKPYDPWVYFEDPIIITIGHSQAKLSIYDSCNGSKLVSKQYEDIINPDSVQVHGDHIGFTTGEHLVIIKTSDFNLVFTTVVTKFSSNLFGFDFVFLGWDLILISKWDETNKIEVWSIEKKQYLSTLKTNGLMFPSNNSAKFFVWNEMVTTIYMLQFW